MELHLCLKKIAVVFASYPEGSKVARKFAETRWDSIILRTRLRELREAPLRCVKKFDGTKVFSTSWILKLMLKKPCDKFLRSFFQKATKVPLRKARKRDVISFSMAFDRRHPIVPSRMAMAESRCQGGFFQKTEEEKKEWI